jgi:PHD/YefM family antitoxin component YafN of YafNO toxin-antitoxin module
MKTVGDTQFASISEAKAQLPKLVEGRRPTVLLRHNQPVAALVSIDRYNDFVALEALIRHPALMDRLRAKAKKARTTPLAQLRSMADLERLDEGRRQRPKTTEKSTAAASR